MCGRGNSMRKIWRSARYSAAVLISLTAIGLPVASRAETFICRVADQIVFTLDQGRSTRYAGFEDGVNVGDTLSVELAPGSLQVGDDTNRIAQLAMSVKRGNGDVVIAEPVIFPHHSIMIEDQIIHNGLKWHPDAFSLGGSGTNFEIRRYYMTDWHGVLTQINASVAYLAAINCLGADGAIQRARRALIENPNVDFVTVPAP